MRQTRPDKEMEWERVSEARPQETDCKDALAHRLWQGARLFVCYVLGFGLNKPLRQAVLVGAFASNAPRMGENAIRMLWSRLGEVLLLSRQQGRV